MYKPFDGRCIVRVNKHFILDKDKKQILSDDGQPIYEPEQECKVIASDIPDIKRGMTVIPILRGGVPIRLTDTKKTYDVILDREDIYGIKE